jgi:HEAT repeat protein
MELIGWETMLSSKDGDHRIEAAKQLCVLKEISTLDALKERFILEPNEYVRYWIAYALGKVGGEAAYEMLEEAQAREKNPFAQQGIQDALDEIKTSIAFKPKS